MGFYDIYRKYSDIDFEKEFGKVSPYNIKNAIEKDYLGDMDFLALLSHGASPFLEEMAQKARRLTHQHFGKVIFMYAPLYLANYCVNRCAYCGFNAQNKIVRNKLTLDEVEAEAKAIWQKGIRHILVLTGESRSQSPVSYIKECIEVLKKYFTSISLEVYPLHEEEYRDLIKSGVDGLTIYQEVYNEAVYDEIHLSGPKKDYRFRLDTPERGCKAGMRYVNIGALLGLEDWRKEAFFTGLHAKYLQDKYIDTEISLSLPRMRPHSGDFQPKCIVTDAQLVQIMLAFRLLLPRAGITVSTRESSELRDNLIGLGVTRMSAGSSTEVGGYFHEGKSESQFEVSDSRSVDEIRDLIYSKGYQPVFKDWQYI